MRTIIILGIVYVIICVFVIYTMRTMQAYKKMDTNQKFVRYNKWFTFFWDFYPTRHSFRQVFNQIGSLGVYNYKELRILVTQYYGRAIALSVLVLLVIIVGFGDIVSALMAVMFMLIFMQNTINARIDEINVKTYDALAQLLLALREAYTMTNSISDALMSNKVPTLLKLQVDQIYHIVSDKDGSRLLSKFYETCPNRIMRTLATTCYIRNDSGDSENGTSFKDALLIIKDEVDAQRVNLLQQKVMFKSLSALPIVPVFMYPAIVIFYRKIIPATGAVFDGFWGYIIKILLLLISVICYYVISTMNNASYASVDDTNYLLRRLLYNSRVRRFAKTLLPKKWKTRHRIEQDLKSCLSSKDPIYFALECHVYAVLGVLFAIFVTVFIVVSGRSLIRGSLQSYVMTTQTALTAEEEKNMYALDNAVLEEPEAPSAESVELKEHISKILLYASDMDISAQARRIASKYKMYHALVFHWWYGFIYLLIALICFRVPYFLLRFRVKLVTEEALIDVLQLQTIIAILMDTPIDTYGLVYWLMMSSDIHKAVLTDCYMQYPYDPIRAIRNLRYTVTLPEFVAICDKLEATVFDISIRDAFEDLIKDRATVLKMRSITQADKLKTKRNTASPIALAPLWAWIVLCFIVPIAIVAVSTATQVTSGISAIQQ